MTTKRHRRAHRRRALQSARDARRRTERKLIDLRDPDARQPQILLAPAYAFGPLVIDEALR